MRILIESQLKPLVEAGLLEEETLNCPGNRSSSSFLGSDYEVNPVHVDGLQEMTWLVRDRWKRGFDDPSGNNNRHGKGQFNFLHGDMNFVGDAEAYFQLYEQ